jgi:hypothetical protein
MAGTSLAMTEEEPPRERVGWVERRMAAETKKWSEVITAAGIKAG